ncbi:non-ribosomal peptide synthetase [Hamadaea tsunoensis]|uniref:non-ribosomal peptide synthetase n=1 Tax=Hamadaea tsunoensis TaxID=53368 RepID=UPI00040263FB|nr:non-ribosomal peptide synthetase [Hamadaea tsunoensis]
MTPWDHTIPELFTRQARQAPDAVAVSCAGSQLTYAELDEQSGRIASWLCAHGVGVEDVVAVRLPRGIDLVATVLGIVKAGAVYLAVEAEAPPARAAELIAAAGARALVTDTEADDSPLPELVLPGGLAEAAAVPLPDVHPENLAYIAFTSGSTGAPKGVGVPHRAVARLVLGDAADFGPGHVFLLLAPVSFDASTLEIWGPLLTGGRLAVHPPGPVDLDGLARVLDQEGVTSLWLTAGLFHRMVDHRPDALGRLHQLLAGGDVLDPARAAALLARHPHVRLVNGYGPTENTTFATCNTITSPVRDHVPIGRPIAGTRLYVLDPALRPVEPGDRGELWIAGAGLSRGYVTDAAATADRFRPDPFAAEPGARMYRTGDLVRAVGDGELEFLGRADRQVKIRGFRVEPGEIERTMTSLPGVREAVVLSAGTGSHDTHLVAYVCTQDGAPAEHLSTWMRRELRRLVPPYLIPSAFIAVDELPLTANGKVDRARLAPPERAERDSDADFVAASSPTEQLVCDMWAEALGIDRVGVLDEFFELGGNSLLAMDLVSRTEAVAGLPLPYRVLLENPTVHEFATAVDALLGQGSEKQ